MMHRIWKYFLFNTEAFRPNFVKFVFVSTVLIFLASTTNVWAQVPSQADETKPIPWYQVATGILAIPVTIFGLYYTYKLSEKIRLESKKLQLEILEKEGKLPPETPRVFRREDLLASPQAIAASIQDFVIRFIILYITIFGWALIERLLSPFLFASVNVWINKQPDWDSSWIANFLLVLVSQITMIGDLVIFLALGWPLLSDIAKAIGVQPFDLFRKR